MANEKKHYRKVTKTSVNLAENQTLAQYFAQYNAILAGTSTTYYYIYVNDDEFLDIPGSFLVQAVGQQYAAKNVSELPKNVRKFVVDIVIEVLEGETLVVKRIKESDLLSTDRVIGYNPVTNDVIVLVGGAEDQNFARKLYLRDDFV